MPEHLPSPTPHRAVYGFALYFLFNALFYCFLCWIFLPEYILEIWAGLFYLPDKYFGFFIPVLILTGTTAFAFLIYPCINFIITPEVVNICTILDSSAICRCCFKTVNGNLCGKVIKSKINDSENKLWCKDTFCVWHKTKDEIVNEADYCVNNLSICDCSQSSNCYLTKKKNSLIEVKVRKKIAPVRDLHIAYVCHELYGE